MLFRYVSLFITSLPPLLTIYYIQYYSPQIFASIGIDTSTTLGLQSGNSVIALIGEVLCVWYIDKLGRRWPLIWANAISGLTFVIGTIIIAVFPAGSDNHNASRSFVAMTWLVSGLLLRYPGSHDLSLCFSVQPSILIRNRSSQLGCKSSARITYYARTLSPIHGPCLDPRRDVQLRNTSQSYSNHLFSCMDIQLHVTSSFGYTISTN